MMTHTPRNPRPRHFARLHCETLEDRRLLCGLSHDYLIDPPEWSNAIEQQQVALQDGEPGGGGPQDAVGIIWANRGQTSDNFAATFGTSAMRHCAVVDAALSDWQRVITNWNRNDGSTTLQLNISINGSGFGAAGAPAATAPADGKPTTGSITLGSGNDSSNPNDSNGWYLDPNPSDWAEFDGPMINAFAGSSTANLGADFYSVVSAEVTHTLGLISDKNNNGGSWNGYRLESSGFAASTNIVDSSEGSGLYGRFWTFNGPTISHLMTSYNSGDATNASWGNIIHTAGTANQNINSVNYQSSEDVGNALYFNSQRTMPSWVATHVLADAYGYTVSDPEVFGSMHASRDNTNGVLTVRGGSGNSSDVITLSSVSVLGLPFITVSIDVGNDVPGTRHLAGAGNLPAWQSTFLAGTISSVVIDGGGGQDFIRIESNAGRPVTVNGGDGDDYIDFAFGSRNLSNITASTTVNGGAGTDNIFVYDNNHTTASTYSVTDARFDRPGWGGFFYAADVEGLTLTTGSAADTVNVPSTYPGQPVLINSSGGQDVVNLGNSTNGVQQLRAQVQIHNDPSFTTLNISDVGNSTARNIVIDQWAGNFGAIAGLSQHYIVWDNADISSIHITTGSGDDNIDMLRMSERMYLSSNGGNDQISVGNNTDGISQITGVLDIGPNPAFVFSDLTINDSGGSIGEMLAGFRTEMDSL